MANKPRKKLICTIQRYLALTSERQQSPQTPLHPTLSSTPLLHFFFQTAEIFDSILYYQRFFRCSLCSLKQVKYDCNAFWEFITPMDQDQDPCPIHQTIHQFVTWAQICLCLYCSWRDWSQTLSIMLKWGVVRYAVMLMRGHVCTEIHPIVFRSIQVWNPFIYPSFSSAVMCLSGIQEKFVILWSCYRFFFHCII